MKRRRLLWLAVVLLLAGAALAVAIDASLFKRGLESVGLSKGEVDEALGGPPAIKAPWTDPESGAQLKPGWRAMWYSERGNVAVDFDGEGRVEAAPIYVAPR
jgi:hypothetical protein